MAVGRLPTTRQGIAVIVQLSRISDVSMVLSSSLANNGKLGTTVAGTIRVLLAAIPDFQLEKRRLQMNKFRFTINLLAIAIFTFAFASMAQAQATRTWVSGVGDDANPCSRTAPCKTFAGAISKTAVAG